MAFTFISNAHGPLWSKRMKFSSGRSSAKLRENPNCRAQPRSTPRALSERRSSIAFRTKNNKTNRNRLLPVNGRNRSHALRTGHLDNRLFFHFSDTRVGESSYCTPPASRSHNHCTVRSAAAMLICDLTGRSMCAHSGKTLITYMPIAIVDQR